jgi:MoxR-like ATPase
VAERGCRLVTVVGAPGLGKSRLAHEFATRLGERATVLRGRCLPYGEGITFWPLAEMLREAGGITESDGRTARSRSSRRCSSRTRRPRDRRDDRAPDGPDGNAWPRRGGVLAVRRLVAALAAARPLVLLPRRRALAEATLLELVRTSPATRSLSRSCCSSSAGSWTCSSAAPTGAGARARVRARSCSSSRSTT